MKKYFLIIIVLLIVTGCNSQKTIAYLEKTLDTKLNNCQIIKERDTHRGFLGDGDYKVLLNCSNSDFSNNLTAWQKLPLTKNLQSILYDGLQKDFDNINSSAFTIPLIKNGYYYFINRHTDAISTNSDANLFDVASFNFTLALYDIDSNLLYYYELDT